MDKVSIMTDTISQISREIADQYDITIVPMGIIIDGKLYRENDVDLPEYYKNLLQIKDKEKLPTSSSISAGEFLEACRNLSKKANGIVYISHSIRLGMSSKAALEAKQRLQEEQPDIQIEVIDPATAVGAQMFIAIETAKAAAAGKSFTEVVGVAMNMIPKVKYIVLVDNLDYFSSGGRILDGRSWADVKVSTKALLETDNTTGKVHAPLARYKTKTKAMEGLLELMKERYGDKKLHIAINHANVPDEADYLKNRLSSQLKCVETYITEIYPVVGRHAGPLNIFLSWWAED